MKVLILSAYNAVSHDQLNKGLVRNLPEVDFTVLTLPPRFFNWRSRGNSLSFAFEFREELLKGYDLIFATSLTDMTSLRGFVPEIADIPLIMYFHENQFDYPESRSTHAHLEVKIVSVYNAIVGDRVVFNTEYNRESFLKGAHKFLRKMPDHVPKGLMDMVREKSEIISVPIDPISKGEKPDTPTILWNHRWEFDKGPDKFLLALRELKKLTDDFRLIVAGQVFKEIPEAFKTIEKEFAEHIDHWGYASSREAYEKLVAESTHIISTTLHDYQGLSVMEAATAGCIPVLPDRVAYPYLFDKRHLYKTDNDPETEARNCAELILKLGKDTPECDMSSHYWDNLAKEYSDLFRRMI